MSISPGFGVVLRDLPGTPLTDGVVAAVGETARLGGSSLQVPLAAVLDLAGARTLRAALAAEAVEATMSIGVLNAVFPERNPLLGGDLLGGLESALAAARGLGIRVAHFTVGALEDRFGLSGGPGWTEQLEMNGELLARAAGIAATADVTLVLKTHEEMATAEVAVLASRVDSPALRVGFSAVNVLTRLEEPGAALERVLPFVHTLFLDDAALERTSTGLRRHLVGIGAGAVDWPALIARAEAASQPIALVLDLHRAEFDMPLFAPGWLSHEPQVTVAELARLFAAARAAAPVAESPESRFETARAFALVRRPSSV